MSGGSFNYLYATSASLISDDFNPDSLNDMASYLENWYPGSAAATETRTLAIKVKTYKDLVEHLENQLLEGTDRLRNVWRAAEMFCSNDGSDTDLDKEIKLLDTK